MDCRWNLPFSRSLRHVATQPYSHFYYLRHGAALAAAIRGAEGEGRGISYHPDSVDALQAVLHQQHGQGELVAYRTDELRQFVDLEGARILDVGCGIGTYVRRFRGYSDDVHGIEVEEARPPLDQAIPEVELPPGWREQVLSKGEEEGYLKVPGLLDDDLGGLADPKGAQAGADEAEGIQETGAPDDAEAPGNADAKGPETAAPTETIDEDGFEVREYGAWSQPLVGEGDEGELRSVHLRFEQGAQLQGCALRRFGFVKPSLHFLNMSQYTHGY